MPVNFYCNDHLLQVKLVCFTFKNDDDADLLTPSDVVDADDGHVDDGRMTQEDSLNVEGADFESARSRKNNIDIDLGTVHLPVLPYCPRPWP